jgi:hypothetical protein
MEKEISVLYKIGSREDAVLVSYSIDMVSDIQTITCNIRKVSTNSLHWLQLRKFELRSMHSAEGYMPLFSDNSNIKNRDAVLFIDKTYRDIMAIEKFKMVEQGPQS